MIEPSKNPLITAGAEKSPGRVSLDKLLPESSNASFVGIWAALVNFGIYHAQNPDPEI